LIPWFLRIAARILLSKESGNLGIISRTHGASHSLIPWFLRIAARILLSKESGIATPHSAPFRSENLGIISRTQGYTTNYDIEVWNVNDWG
jgi:hypothetical protein